MQKRTASIIGGVGRTLIGLGLIVIMFAVFQLYGTGILEAQAQAELTTEFDQRLAELEAAGLIDTSVDGTAVDDTAGDDTSVDDTSVDDTSVDDTAVDTDGTGTTDPEPTDAPVRTVNEQQAIDAAIAAAFPPELGERDGPEFSVVVLDPDALSDEEVALLTPRPGEALGTIEIPDIGLERNIVEGIRRDDLRQGPGHYPGSPLPGQPGNVAIAGHRSTYGEPFRDLHLLQPGDLIKITTFLGESFYQVMAHTDEEGRSVGHFIVDPSQTEVLDDYGDNRLTLTACHPYRSARQRIVVTAQLVSAPQEVLPTLSPEQLSALTSEADEEPEAGAEDDPVSEVDENALEESLGWNLEERTPTLLWGAASLAIVIGALLAARRWRRWIVYAGATPAFAATLFFCFVHLDRMLPAL